MIPRIWSFSINMKYTRKLEATAYHEAGHAVAAWKLRTLKPKEVSIRPEEESNSLGRIIFQMNTSKLNPEWDDSTRSRLRMESCVIIDQS